MQRAYRLTNAGPGNIFIRNTERYIIKEYKTGRDLSTRRRRNLLGMFGLILGGGLKIVYAVSTQKAHS